MKSWKINAALLIVLALTLVLPVSAGAKPPSGFRPTHLARIEGSTLSASDQPVKQESTGKIIHADPAYQSYVVTISEGFFENCSLCPQPATYDAYLSINDYDRDNVWHMIIDFEVGGVWYFIQVDGVLNQVMKGSSFTFIPAGPPDVQRDHVPIGYGDSHFSIVGTPIN